MLELSDEATLLRHVKGNMLMHTAEITLHIETDDTDETLSAHYVVTSEFVCVNPDKGFCATSTVSVWRTHSYTVANEKFDTVFAMLSQAGMPLIIMDVDNG